MKRLPVLLSFIAVLALSASLAYWAMNLFQPPQRLIAPAALASAPEARLDAAAGLFGGQKMAILASNYQLTGVVAAGEGNRSAAIMVLNGKPSQSVPVGRDIVPGVALLEVHPKYVLLSEGGSIKRIELAADSNPLSPGLIRVPAVAPAFSAPTPPAAPEVPVQMPAPPGIIVVPPGD